MARYTGIYIKLHFRFPRAATDETLIEYNKVLNLVLCNVVLGYIRCHPLCLNFPVLAMNSYKYNSTGTYVSIVS
jgi:hypothetical protein